VARDVRGAVAGAASWANDALEETGNMSALHLIAQLRSSCFDLLRALSVPQREAYEVVRASNARRPDPSPAGGER
jgi:hypothetical protein